MHHMNASSNLGVEGMGHLFSVGAPPRACHAYTVSFPTVIGHKKAVSEIY